MQWRSVVAPSRSLPNAALTAYLNGTELGPLDRYFNPETDPAVLRCATPDPFPYAWDFSGACVGAWLCGAPVQKPALLLWLHGKVRCAGPCGWSRTLLVVTPAPSGPPFDAAETWACPTLYTLPRFFKSAPEVANSSGAQS